jgi:hypothetical protein
MVLLLMYAVVLYCASYAGAVLCEAVPVIPPSVSIELDMICTYAYEGIYFHMYRSLGSLQKTSALPLSALGSKPPALGS